MKTHISLNILHALPRFFALVMVLLVCSSSASMAFTQEQYKKKMTRNAEGTESVVMCPVCPVINAFMKGGLNLTEVVAAEISASLSTLVGVMLAIGLLIQGGKLLYPFGPLDRASKILNETFSRLSIGVMVALFIQSSTLYMNYILYPIIDTTVSVSNTLLTTASKYGNNATIDSAVTVDENNCPIARTTDPKQQIINSITSQARVAQRSIGLGMCSAMLALGFDTCFEGKPQTCGASTNASTSTTTQLTPLGTFFKVLDSVTAFESLKKIAGNTLRFGADVVTKGNPFSLNLMNVITAMIVAFLIFGIYGYLWLIYPIYMLDFVFKWIVISIFFPIIAVSVIFPSTRGTATAALKGLGNAGLTAVMMATIVGIIVNVTDTMFLQDDLLKQMKETDKIFMEQGNYWIVLMSGFLMLHMVKQCPKLAGYFFDSKIDANLAQGLIGIIRKCIETGVNLVVDASTAGASAGMRNAVKGVVAAGKMAVPK
jgi:hypothetical protein